MWADSLLPATSTEQPLIVSRSPAWWAAAIIIGLAYILTLGRGVHLPH